MVFFCMVIHLKFVKEQKRYSKKDLMEIFSLDNQSVIIFIKRLKLRDVLKRVNNTINQKNSTDWLDDDIEILDDDFENDDYLYIFTFVGVLTIDDIVIVSFPKYMLTKTEPFNEMKEIIKVLRKYDSDENIMHFYSGFDEEKEFNLLSACLYIINDYYENGVYTNQKDIVETNGEGEILWDNTINDTFALIIRNKPFYLELKTRNVDDDEMDYISRLHKFIITDCCKKLKAYNLLTLFEINELHLSDESLENFGERDYIIYRLQSELNVQFITKKQILLKTLCMYIEHSKSFKEYIGLNMYGTNSFHNVWERACASVFGNNLKTPLNKLNLPVSLNKDYEDMERKNLLEIIEKPKWIYFGSKKKEHDANDTLKPDLISLYKVKNDMCFGIFDAKYYNLILDEKHLKNAPGVSDITKQYLYQMAFNDFISKHEFSYIANAFLMPTEEEGIELVGEVKMNILEGLSFPPLINISVMKISAKKVFKYYLKNKKINIYKLKLHKKVEN